MCYASVAHHASVAWGRPLSQALLAPPAICLWAKSSTWPSRCQRHCRVRAHSFIRYAHLVRHPLPRGPRARRAPSPPPPQAPPQCRPSSSSRSPRRPRRPPRSGWPGAAPHRNRRGEPGAVVIGLRPMASPTEYSLPNSRGTSDCTSIGLPESARTGDRSRETYLLYLRRTRSI